jgi:hypothetical protein
MISHILTITAVSFVMGMLYSASKGKSKEDLHGNLVLQLPKFYWFLGAFGLLIGVTLLVVANFYVDVTDGKIIAICLSLGPIILGGVLFAKGYNSKIVVTENEIIETGLFGRKTQIYLNEIQSISFGNISLELTIKGKGKKIKAHAHLFGFRELMERLSEKTGYTPAKMGLPMRN